jgi:phage tail sheath gpL-like
MPQGIIFQYIPGSGVTAPGQFFEVNSGGQYQTITRMILIGYGLSTGSLPVNTPTPVSSQQQADALAGPGSMLREMFRVSSANAPVQPIWLVRTTEPGTPKAIWTLTIIQPAPGQGWIEICGRRITVPVGAADTPTTIAAALAAAINAYYDTLTNAMLPVTATSALGVLTLTARHSGVGLAASMLVDIYVSPDPTNVLGATGITTVANPTPGTGTPPDIAGALASLDDQPADFIVSPFPDTTSLTSASAALNDVSGRWAWSRQAYGHYWTAMEASFAALTTFGLTMNDRHITTHGAFPTSVSPVWEWIAGICGAEASWLSDITTGNVSRNQTGKVVIGIKGPRAAGVQWPYASRNVLLNSGISTTNTDPYGNVTIDKTITMYRTGVSGQPDTVFRDIQAMYQASLGIQFIRAMTAVQLGMKAFAADNPGNLGAIVTPNDVKTCFIAAYTILILQGVFQNVDGFARNIQIQANAQNPARCDVLAPIDRVNPLDILAANAVFYQQFPANF